MTKRLFIVDAMAMAFRNFHAFGVRPMSNSQGLPTSALFGSAQFLLKIVEEERPDYFVIATDSAAPTFRHELYSAYKANRKDMPEDLAKQIPHLFRLFAAMGIPLLKQNGVEADDLIGSVVKRYAREGVDCYIVSGDKDFMQLVNGNVSMYVPKKGTVAAIVNKEGVKEKFSCTPEQVIDVLAIMGDSSDNIPGIRGIGEKGAAKLIEQFGSLDAIYERIEEVRNEKLKKLLIEQKDQAYMSKKLATIHCDIEDIPPVEHFAYSSKQLANDSLLGFFQEMEFRRLTDVVARMLTETKDAVTRESTAKALALTKYHLVQTEDALAALIAKLYTASKFSFDTETTGLNIVSDRPIGLSFSMHEGEAYYLPLESCHGQTLGLEDIVAQLKPVFANTKAIKVAHNLKFDLQMLRNIGIEVAFPLADTLIASYLLNSNSRTHGIDACCIQHFGYAKIPTSALLGKDKKGSMLDVEISALCKYACEDADFTLRLYEYFLPQLAQQGIQELFEKIEVPLVPIIARMEQYGVYVDRIALGKIAEFLESAIAELEAHIHRLAGEVFNINSPKQLQQILFEKLRLHEELGLTRLKKTQSGYSTDVSVLERMGQHPLPAALLEYRTLSKLLGTYVQTLPELIHPKTGRIHASFHQWGTATGRLSSSDPNLQNIPVRSQQGREIRRAFSAQSQDWRIISADYSQVELRLLAHLADDAALIAAFQRGEDIHVATAAKIFGIDPKDVDKNMRGQAKAINFGIIYGMGASRLARETGVSYKEAEIFIQKYFAGYPSIRRYIDQSIASANANHCTRTIMGRMRPFINDEEERGFVNMENIAVNSPIQGSAADLIKIAMINIEQEVLHKGLRLRMLMQVHDELVFECPLDEIERAVPLIRDTMQNAMQLKVPLIVDVGVGNNWLEAH